METADYLNLSWNSHLKNFKTVLKDLHQVESLSDVTLVCIDGTEIMAHKFVLIGSSPVFRSMLYQNSQRDRTIVYLRGVSKIELEWVLQFMYLGQTQVPPTKLQSFLDLAKDLKMKGMCDEDDPDDSEEKLAKKQRNMSTDDTVVHDSTGDLQVYTQEGKQKIQEEVVYKNLSEDVLDPRTQNTIHRSFGTTSTSPKVKKVATVDSLTLTNDVYENNSEIKQISKFKLQNCNECEYSTPRRQQLKHHIETNHEGIRYPCDVCNHQSRSVENLRDHQSSKHKINPRFRCLLCDFCTNHTRVKRDHVLKQHPESIGQEIFQINKQPWKPWKQGDIKF